MEGEKFVDLEEKMYDAYQKYSESCDTLTAAQEKVKETEEAYYKASASLSEGCDYRTMETKTQEFHEAWEAMNKAQETLEQAEFSFDEATKAAQEAEEKFEEKKKELRESRDTSTDYVVHGARIECSCAVRYSCLGLDTTHGVLTRLLPQLTVKDAVPKENLITFGNCTSMENPKVKEAAQKALDDAQKKIEENKGIGDKIVDCFVKKEETTDLKSMEGQVLGECIMTFPAGSVWLKGRDGVSINDEAPLMRRCELTCIYGGRITILFSGQPE